MNRPEPTDDGLDLVRDAMRSVEESVRRRLHIPWRGIGGATGTAVSLADPLLRQVSEALLARLFGAACLILATALWSARAAYHVRLGRLADRDMAWWTRAELAIAVLWCVSVAGSVCALPDGVNAVLVGTAWLASFAEAQLGEVALARVNRRRRARGEQEVPTGRDQLRTEHTRNLVAGEVIDSIRSGLPVLANLNKRCRKFAFSGLVAWAILLGMAYQAGLCVNIALSLASKTGTPRDDAPRERATSTPITGPTFAARTPDEPSVDATSKQPPIRIAHGPTYDELCADEGQEPGADVQGPAAEIFHHLFLGPGGLVAGCAQPTRRGSDGTCMWEIGKLNGEIRSVAVVDGMGHDALFLDDSAIAVLELQHDGLCVGGTRHIHVDGGDVQLIYSERGTQALIRATEYSDDGATPHLLLSAAQTQAWLYAMTDLGEWLWPETAGYRIVELQDEFGSPVGARIISRSSREPLASDTVELREGQSAVLCRGGALMPWRAFALYAQ